MKNRIMPGIPDDMFMRGDVPMTKEEIRVISLSKLRLEPDSVLLDIGAGTGSVSIEAAMLLGNSLVYAIEKNNKACELIKQNAEKIKVTNIKIIHGEAPDALPDIKFDRVFIGGSGGSMKGILEWISGRILKGGIIVVNAIALETLEITRSFFTEKKYEFETIQAQITRTERAGNSTMLKAINPVFIISGHKSTEVMQQ